MKYFATSITTFSILFLVMLVLIFSSTAHSQAVKRNPKVSPSPSGHNVDLDSRGGAQTMNLGGGRGRLRVPFEPLTPASLDDQGRISIDRPSFLVDWLRQDLPKRFPGIDKVELVETILSRDTGKELIASTSRDLEILGDLQALGDASKWLSELLALRDVKIQMDCRFVKRTIASNLPVKTRVELLDGKAVAQLLASFDKPERQLTFSLTNGRHDRRRDLETRKFLRQVRVEKLESGEIVVPEIKTAYEGFQGRSAALLLPGARELIVDCDFGLGMIARPVPFKNFELLGRNYRIESPEVVSVRWTSDRIVLGPEEVGFRVSGIVLPYSADSESTPQTTLDILVQLHVEPSKKRFILGRVIGFDESQGLAFSRVNNSVNLQPGRRLSVTRKGRVVGRVEVVEIVGGMTTLRPIKGKIARGDEIR